jgi:hypothetical protein
MRRSWEKFAPVQVGVLPDLHQPPRELEQRQLPGVMFVDN